MNDTNLLYRTTMIVNDGMGYSELCGFVTKGTEEHFDGVWNVGGIFHDVIEHWFENSEYFETDDLSQAGECVAMGIRTWFADYSGLINDYAFFNRQNGIEWNSFSVMLGQVQESEEHEYSIYPNDFNYKTHPEIENELHYLGYSENYDKIYNLSKELHTKIDTAFSYGWNLAEYLFSDADLQAYDNFFENVKLFLSHSGIDDFNLYDCPDFMSNMEWTFEVGKNGINSIITLNGDVFTISDKTSEEEIQKIVMEMGFVHEFEF